MQKQQRRRLKALAHGLKPIVRIGQHGLHANVLMEIDRALTDHELVKIRVAAADRDDRQAMVTSICESTTATLVATTGHVAVLFRRNAEAPVIDLSETGTG